MSKKTRGRPRKDFSLEAAKQVIIRYMDEKQITGLLSYMEIFHYSNELFENNEIDSELTEYFWRKGLGRNLIDKTNEILEHKVPSGHLAEDEERIIDTRDAIEKHFKGKEFHKTKLIGLLKMNENKLGKYITENSRIKSKLNKYEDELERNKETIKQLRNQVNQYEQLMFMWLEASVDDKVPLTNLLTSGKSRTKVVEHFFETIFSENPMGGFDRFESLRNQKNIKVKTKNNVVSYEQKDEKSAFDDIDF